MHHRPLWREHIRILLLGHLLLLFLRQRRSILIHRRGGQFAIARLQHPSRGMGWRAELVRLREDARFALIGRGRASGCDGGECGGRVFGGGGFGRSADDEVAESQWGDASREEELGDCSCCHDWDDYCPY